MLDRNIAPPIHQITDFDFVRPLSQKMANGVSLHIVSSGVQPLINLQMSFQVSDSQQKTSVLGNITSKMFTEGTKKRTASQINAEIEKYGAALEIESGFDFCTFDLYCLNKHLSPMLDLLHEILTEATFPEQELEKLRNISLQKLKINKEKTAFVASQTFRNALFGEHSYASRMTEENLLTISRQDLLAHYEEIFVGKPFQIIAAGMVSDREINLIKEKIGQIPINSPQQKPIFAPSYFPKAQKIYLEKENAMQTSIRIGKPLFQKNHEDSFAFGVLNEILGGYFGSRLMKNIREEKGFTYGIHSTHLGLKESGYWVISTDVAKEVRDQTIAEIFKEINIIKTELIDNEELETVKSYMKGGFINAMTTSFAVANHFRTVFYYGVPAERLYHYISNIDAITAQQVQEMANKYLSGDFWEVMVG